MKNIFFFIQDFLAPRVHVLAIEFGVGSSNAPTPMHPRTSQHIPGSIFASPPINISLDTQVGTTPSRTHITPPQTFKNNPIDQCMTSYPRSSHVKNIWTLPCMFLVNEDLVPIKKPKILGIFQWFNCSYYLFL